MDWHRASGHVIMSQCLGQVKAFIPNRGRRARSLGKPSEVCRITAPALGVQSTRESGSVGGYDRACSICHKQQDHAARWLVPRSCKPCRIARRRSAKRTAGVRSRTQINGVRQDGNERDYYLGTQPLLYIHTVPYGMCMKWTVTEKTGRKKE